MSRAWLTQKDVRHVAKLSNLKLTSFEIQKFQKQLSKVIEYVTELNEVETKGIEPSSQTTGLTNITREDKFQPKQGLSLEQALSGTKKTFRHYFSVPYVFTKNN